MKRLMAGNDAVDGPDRDSDVALLRHAVRPLSAPAGNSASPPTRLTPGVASTTLPLMRVAHALFAAILFTACKSEIDEKPAATVKDAGKDAKAEAPKAVAGGPTLDAASSSIGFVGSKVSLDHPGAFKDFTAAVTLDGDTLTALQLEVETGSVAIEPEQLREHLVTADFFDAAKYSTATFSSTKITPGTAPATHMIEGNLELRGKTVVISFPATVTVDATHAKGKAEFTVNRKDFGIEYPGKPDDLIRDEVLLKIDLNFKR